MYSHKVKSDEVKFVVSKLPHFGLAYFARGGPSQSSFELELLTYILLAHFRNSNYYN